jgi:hypothetical protein
VLDECSQWQLDLSVKAEILEEDRELAKTAESIVAIITGIPRAREKNAFGDVLKRVVIPWSP